MKKIICQSGQKIKINPEYGFFRFRYKGKGYWVLNFSGENGDGYHVVPERAVEMAVPYWSNGRKSKKQKTADKPDGNRISFKFPDGKEEEIEYQLRKYKPYLGFEPFKPAGKKYKEYGNHICDIIEGSEVGTLAKKGGDVGVNCFDEIPKGANVVDNFFETPREATMVSIGNPFEKKVAVKLLDNNGNLVLDDLVKGLDDMYT